jgi:glycine cleavage system regulatory protein
VTDLVLTLIGPDRPGLVESMADRVAAHGGNWLGSRMARLAGQFAGILHVEVADERLAQLRASLAELESQGVKVVAVGGATSEPGGERTMDLDLVGQDHPGIVRDVAHVLLHHGVNIEELTTDRTSAPMAGGRLFRTRARLHVPEGANLDGLRHDLEEIADDLMVDLTLVQAVVGRRSRPRG